MSSPEQSNIPEGESKRIAITPFIDRYASLLADDTTPDRLGPIRRIKAKLDGFHVKLRHNQAVFGLQDQTVILEDTVSVDPGFTRRGDKRTERRQIRIEKPDKDSIEGVQLLMEGDTWRIMPYRRTSKKTTDITGIYNYPPPTTEEYGSRGFHETKMGQIEDGYLVIGDTPSEISREDFGKFDGLLRVIDPDTDLISRNDLHDQEYMRRMVETASIENDLDK